MLTSQRTSPLSMEGTATAQWILMDCGDVVVHIFRADIRGHYGLEHLWSDAKRVRLPAHPATPGAVSMSAPKARGGRVRKQG